MTLHRRLRARVATYAALATFAGCGSYEHNCELNPYACAESDPGNPPSCGPCEIDSSPGGCAPVPLPGDGTCGGNGRKTCSPDLECKNAKGESCKVASECATGVCDPDLDKCVSCDGDADCEAHPDRHVCAAGWCRRPAGGECVASFACVTNHCVMGVCTECLFDQECASGACDQSQCAP